MKKIYLIILYLLLSVSCLSLAIITWCAINNAFLINDMCFQFTLEEYVFTKDEVKYFVYDLLWPLCKICMFFILFSIILLCIIIKQKRHEE